MQSPVGPHLYVLKVHVCMFLFFFYSASLRWRKQLSLCLEWTGTSICVMHSYTQSYKHAPSYAVMHVSPHFATPGKKCRLTLHWKYTVNNNSSILQQHWWQTFTSVVNFSIILYFKTVLSSIYQCVDCCLILVYASKPHEICTQMLNLSHTS